MGVNLFKSYNSSLFDRSSIDPIRAKLVLELNESCAIEATCLGYKYLRDIDLISEVIFDATSILAYMDEEKFSKITNLEYCFLNIVRIKAENIQQQKAKSPFRKIFNSKDSANYVELLLSLLEKNNPTYTEILRLYYLEEHSLNSVAEIMDISYEDSKKTLMLAKVAFAKLLNSIPPDDDPSTGGRATDSSNNVEFNKSENNNINSDENIDDFLNYMIDNSYSVINLAMENIFDADSLAEDVDDGYELLLRDLEDETKVLKVIGLNRNKIQAQLFGVNYNDINVNRVVNSVEKKKDDLHDLIHSLSELDKYYFMISTIKMYEEGEDYIVLFSAIEEQVTFDEKLLIKQLSDYKFARCLFMTRYLLFKLIQKTIRKLRRSNKSALNLCLEWVSKTTVEKDKEILKEDNFIILKKEIMNSILKLNQEKKENNKRYNTINFGSYSKDSFVSLIYQSNRFYDLTVEVIDSKVVKDVAKKRELPLVIIVVGGLGKSCFTNLKEMFWRSEMSNEIFYSDLTNNAGRENYNVENQAQNNFAKEFNFIISKTIDIELRKKLESSLLYAYPKLFANDEREIFCNQIESSDKVKGGFSISFFNKFFHIRQWLLPLNLSENDLLKINFNKIEIELNYEELLKEVKTSIKKVLLNMTLELNYSNGNNFKVFNIESTFNPINNMSLLNRYSVNHDEDIWNRFIPSSVGPGLNKVDEINLIEFGICHDKFSLDLLGRLELICEETNVELRLEPDCINNFNGTTYNVSLSDCLRLGQPEA